MALPTLPNPTTEINLRQPNPVIQTAGRTKNATKGRTHHGAPGVCGAGVGNRVAQTFPRFVPFVRFVASLLLRHFRSDAASPHRADATGLSLHFGRQKAASDGSDHGMHWHGIGIGG
jgi:hypothetical protein